MGITLDVIRSMRKSGMAQDAAIRNTVLEGRTCHHSMNLADTLTEDMSCVGIALVVPRSKQMGGMAESAVTPHSP